MSIDEIGLALLIQEKDTLEVRVAELEGQVESLVNSCNGRLPADSSDSVLVEAIHIMRLNAALKGEAK